jgi:hypothetical protein
MTCDEVQDILGAYLVHALSGEEKLAVETHLSACRECKKYFEELLSLDALLRQEVPKYWQGMQPDPRFLARLERMEVAGVNWWDSIVKKTPSWLRRPRLARGVALVAAILAIVVLVREMSYWRRIPTQLSELTPTAKQGERIEMPLIPQLPVPLSMERAQEQAGFLFHLPSQFPAGIDSQPPLFQVFELEDGRKLIKTSYRVAIDNSLTLYQARIGAKELFLTEGWEHIRSEEEPGKEAFQQARIVELDAGIEAKWAEMDRLQGGKVAGLHWAKEDLEFMLTGPFPLQELMRIARSIQ